MMLRLGAIYRNLKDIRYAENVTIKNPVDKKTIITVNEDIIIVLFVTLGVKIEVLVYQMRACERINGVV